jgi:hypothetical protein
MSTARQRYLAKRASKGPWQITGIKRADYAGVVVIPACDEEQWIFRTLDSLAANDPELLDTFLVLVVVNHRPDAEQPVKIANRRTLEHFTASPLRQKLQLGWIDACSDGFVIPHGGVGAARKLGFDLALTRLRDDHDPTLVCLDADTLVEPNYLETIEKHFSTNSGGAVIPFAHQTAPTDAEQRAIEQYELYMRCYLQGLRQSGSPYAFHTIGSAIACTVSAYVSCGGMNRRQGGEDFYFLQSLVKTSGVSNLYGTTVHPSARLSTRVPFGTGPALRRMLDQPNEVSFCPPAAFTLLGDWLKLVNRSTGLTGSELQATATALDHTLGHFMRRNRLAETWDRLINNYADPAGLLRAFHAWFDGLRTRQLLRHLGHKKAFALMTAAEAAPLFLGQVGLASTGTLGGDLEKLRGWQSCPDPATR